MVVLGGDGVVQGFSISNECMICDLLIGYAYVAAVRDDGDLIREHRKRRVKPAKSQVVVVHCGEKKSAVCSHGIIPDFRLSNVVLLFKDDVKRRSWREVFACR